MANICKYCGTSITLDDSGNWNNYLPPSHQCYSYYNPIHHGPHVPIEIKETNFDKLYNRLK